MLVLLVGCGGDPSPSPDAGAPDAGLRADGGVLAPRAQALCAALDTFVASHHVPGAVMATRFPDGSTHACAAGLASVADGTVMQTSDRFRIGSVTKTFVAATVLLLAEDGLLSLDDRLSRWVPGFDASDPTLAQMLNHTSGLGEYLYDDALAATLAEPHDQSELIALARTKPIVRVPGGRFEYSNTNYLLMGAIIEAATARPWYEVVRARLLEPLGLSDTYAYGFEAGPSGFVDGHEWNGRGYVDVTLAMHPTVASSAGCFVSSAADLLRWAAALYGGEVLRPESLRAMTHDYRVPHAYDGGVYAGAFVGLADFIESDDMFGEWWGHSGGLPGFAANMRYLVDQGRVLVVLVNGIDPSASDNLINVLTNDGWVALLI